jgi:hypothetical protein
MSAWLNNRRGPDAHEAVWTRVPAPACRAGVTNAQLVCSRPWVRRLKENDVDVETVDQEYQQLQQESGQLTQAIQEFATKLQAAGDAGDAQAKEWILDLKGIALGIQQEQLQMQALLQALHGLTENTMQQMSQVPASPAVQASAPPVQGGGLLSRFRSGGFGQAMTQGMGMGVGFGLADSVINSIFN